jgi:hypothetical protein
MVRIRDVAWALAAAAVTLAAPRPVLANPIALTGNVASDFTAANGSVIVPVYQGPGVIAGPDGSNPGQLVGGFDVQSIRLNYDATTDTMSVGIQGYKNAAGLEQIFGDATGNLDPSQDPNPNFGGSKSVAIALAPLSLDANGKPVAGTPAIIAGIPSDKSMGGSGTIDGFTVSQYTNNPSGLEFSFGQQMAQYTGNLAYNPSAAHPDLEFTIKNFSQIPGLNIKNGFYIQAYAGAAGDQDGEVQTAWTFSPAPQGFNAPEPMTWLAWALLAGGAGWRRYRRRASARR